ncbi:hypothetical protein MET9862_01071 [Methylobacterium symbioticum]|uniref:Uncharacterized protein n=1 Tax=Methylobacterium symbioticum TaxID=2584084 RepID=A0A509E8N2_9HYPH|nr:hypothetical protein MET9862_01071 [Methylobacterium symbioticum]
MHAVVVDAALPTSIRAEAGRALRLSASLVCRASGAVTPALPPFADLFRPRSRHRSARALLSRRGGSLGERERAKSRP